MKIVDTICARFTNVSAKLFYTLGCIMLVFVTSAVQPLSANNDYPVVSDGIKYDDVKNGKNVIMHGTHCWKLVYGVWVYVDCY